MRTVFIQAAYIGASILFILGLRSLTRPDKARRGMQQAAIDCELDDKVIIRRGRREGRT